MSAENLGSFEIEEGVLVESEADMVVKCTE